MLMMRRLFVNITQCHYHIYEVSYLKQIQVEWLSPFSISLIQNNISAQVNKIYFFILKFSASSL